MDWKKLLMVCLLLVFLSGCIGQIGPASSPKYWTVSMAWGEDVQNGTEVIILDPGIGGNIDSGIKLKNVTLEFTDKNNDTLKTVEVGDLTVHETENDEIKIEKLERLEYVYLRYDEIINPEDKPCKIEGLKRNRDSANYFKDFLAERCEQ